MKIRLFSLLLLGLAPSAAADDSAVRAAVAAVFPQHDDAQIEASVVAGLSEVAIGTQVFYVSDDGRYVLGGPLLRSADQVNLTDTRVAHARRAVLQSAPDVPRYRYPASDGRHTVTVVTDIDCPYCRRLHKDIPAYNALGIDIEYLMLPRTGRNTPSWYKTVNAACASDPEAAITAAMNGTAAGPVSGATAGEATCEHPIDEHLRLARSLAVTSTPSIVLDDGRLVLGQKAPAELLRLIEAGAASP